MMYTYVYQLSYNGYIFYVGISCDIKRRLAEHICGNGCSRGAYEYMYWHLINGIMPDVSIVAHFKDYAIAQRYESSVIREYAAVGHKLCNTDQNPRDNKIITCNPYPNFLPGNKRITGRFDFLKAIINNYHEQTDRYEKLGYPAIIGR